MAFDCEEIKGLLIYLLTYYRCVVLAGKCAHYFCQQLSMLCSESVVVQNYVTTREISRVNAGFMSEAVRNDNDLLSRKQASNG